ncbi:hypothetical protein PYW07_007676 [Mythimna separata]|uniref:Uncharacterized protein n=1 Tax=Mythimna separata TaxID=271217 RepID=A0AAD7YR98_MYTSE|nr:hypothetical protein PYW07_007676 [Mythimna separata]
MKFWLKDWEDQRQIDLLEALNATEGKKREIAPNMKMAAPSGIPCGDPDQHDFPWGTCLRPYECEEEFRIHRGDMSCGRSWYVCCSYVDTTYDLYQAAAMSFEHDNSLTTDSDIDKGYRDSHEKNKRDHLQRKHEKNKRKRTKRLLKKKIRHSITKIITEITKMLQKAYRNSTSLRISKAKAMMDFIKEMKKQYRKDRQRLVDGYEFDILKYDREMEASLIKIQGVNEAYMNNATFRDIVTNGTVNQKELRKLQREHPVLSLFFKSRRMGGDFEPEQTGQEEPKSEKEELDLDNEEPRLEKEELDLGNEEPRLEIEELYLENEESQLEKERSESEEDDYDVEYGVLYY